MHLYFQLVTKITWKQIHDQLLESGSGDVAAAGCREKEIFRKIFFSAQVIRIDIVFCLLQHTHAFFIAEIGGKLEKSQQ